MLALGNSTSELLLLMENPGFLKKYMWNRNVERCPWPSRNRKKKKKDRKRKSYSLPLISKAEQFIWCKSYDHECLWAVILSDYSVLSGGWTKPRRLMLCVAIRWQACNSELISHESGAVLRGFKRQQHFIIFFFRKRSVKPRFISFCCGWLLQ